MTRKTTAQSRAKRHHLPDFLLGISPILLAAQLMGWLTFFPSALHGHADFRQLYAAGYMVRTGHASELYNYQAQQNFQDRLVGNDEPALPFIRPAYQALLFVPFSLLPYRSAYLAFMALNMVLLAMAFWLLRSKMKNLGRAWRALPVLVFLVFYPIALALMQGQDSILLLALLAAALVSLAHDRRLTAGILVGLGLFKMQIVVPIVLLFLLWKCWHFFAGFALSGGLVSLISVWVVGVTQTSAYARSLFSVGAGLAAGESHFKVPLRVSIMANLRGLIFGLIGGRLPAFWIQALTIVVSITVLLWVARSAPRKLAETDALAIAITASVIVSYYLFMHDLSVLMIPIVITLNRFIEADATSSVLDRVTAWMSAAVLVAPMCIFVIPGHFYLAALPLCAFMVILIWNYRSALPTPSSVTNSTGPPVVNS